MESAGSISTISKKPIDSLSGNSFVRKIFDDDGIQEIGTLAAGLRNKIDNLIGKTDEIVETAKKSALRAALDETERLAGEGLQLTGQALRDWIIFGKICPR